MRLDELSPADRAAVRRALGDSTGRTSSDAPRPPARRTSTSGRWTCVRCGARFRTVAGVETHVDEEHGAGRYEQVLELEGGTR